MFGLTSLNKHLHCKAMILIYKVFSCLHRTTNLQSFSPRKRYTDIFSLIEIVGANFSLCFRFPTCHRVICFALRYFVNYAPLLRAECKFNYIICCLATFSLPIFSCLSVKVFIAVDFFFLSVSPTTNPSYLSICKTFDEASRCVFFELALACSEIKD